MTVDGRHRVGGLCRLALLTFALLGWSCGRAPSPKLLVIGLDGATWDVIEPWIQSGELPNLKALRDRSAWGTLNSVIPYLSPPAWTTAITGVNPGRHGIFDFQRRTGEGRIVSETARSRRIDPIWMRLKGRGPTCAVVNVPMTSPPDELDGVMLSGMPYLDQIDFAYPRTFQDQLRAEGYDRYLDKMEMRIVDGEEQAVFDGLWQNLGKRWELVKRLYTERKYDFFWVVFTETDRVQHMFWKFDDPANPRYDPAKSAQFSGSIKKLWIEQDRILGEFMKLVGRDVWVLVLSDHGFGPMRHELRMGNYLRTAASGISPEDAHQIFSLDMSDAARLYIRRAGVDPGEHFLDDPARRALQRRLIDASLQVVDPSTHEHPVEHAFPDTTVYVGPMVEKGPYVSLLPSPGWFIARGDEDLGYKLPPFGNITSTLSGWHRMNGIFMLAGPEVQPGKCAQTYSLIDVVPTCLYLLRQAIPMDAEGRVMNQLFTRAFASENKEMRAGMMDGSDLEEPEDEQEPWQNIPYIHPEPTRDEDSSPEPPVESTSP